MTVGRTGIPYLDWMCSCVHGCTPESEGCANCFARRTAETRLRGRGGYPVDEPFRVTLNPAALDELYGMRKARRVGIAFMGDLFHPDVPDSFIQEAFDAAYEYIRRTGGTVLFLTKRARRMRDLFVAFCSAAGGIPEASERLWLGVSAENQRRADERIPLLLDIRRLLPRPGELTLYASLEPLLGDVDLAPYLAKTVEVVGADGEVHYRRPEGDPLLQEARRTPGVTLREAPRLDWVVAGGETGPGARPVEASWVIDVQNQAARHGVPFFFKGWGPTVPGRALFGRTWDELPVIAPTPTPPGAHIELAVEPKPYRPEEG